MDFEINLNGEVKTFEQATDVLQAIAETFGSWNNFHPETVCEIWIRKVPSETETLGVSVHDEAPTFDHFGG